MKILSFTSHQTENRSKREQIVDNTQDRFEVTQRLKARKF